VQLFTYVYVNLSVCWIVEMKHFRLGGLVLDDVDESVGFQRSAVYGGLPLLVHLHIVPLGYGARVLGDGGELLVVGGEGGGGELLVVGGEGGGELLVVGGEGGGGELLVVGGEGGGGDEFLVNFVSDTSFTLLHFKECITT
jgi:hypothetical protein